MAAIPADSPDIARNERRFHVWMAAVFVLVAFGGFTPTYWAPLASGRFHAPPIAHIHGLLLFSWTLFYFAQTAWVASGRVASACAKSVASVAVASAAGTCSFSQVRSTSKSGTVPRAPRSRARAS
jgi:hypothetical protein